MQREHTSHEWRMVFGKHFALKRPSEETPQNHSHNNTVSCLDDSKSFVDKVKRQMAEMKDELNYIKSLLNDYDIKKWREHTNFMNLCGHLSKECKTRLNAELCTKAWLKFCTLLNSCEIFQDKQAEKRITSVHLCEAPGAFITCLNHHLTTKLPHITWNWVATTLNPYYDGNLCGIMIDDDRFIRTTMQNWRFGGDFTGDIMNQRNLDDLIKECKHYENVALVTADGSIDCFEDPCMQECRVAPLLYWEVITAFSIMSVDASFVIKVFTVLEEFTISLIYLLWCSFSEVNFVKPGPSKPGNSEVYIVCKGFYGSTVLGQEFFDLAMQRTTVSDFSSPLIPIENIQEEFLSKLVECEGFFIRHQIHAISSNIDSFQNVTKKRRYKINQIKSQICHEFIENFNLKPLEDDNYVCNKYGRQIIPGPYTGEHAHSFASGNFYERAERRTASWTERIDINKISTATKSSIVWFSNVASHVCKEEVDGWSPIPGKKFKRSGHTHFYSNYGMNTLFQARESKDLTGGEESLVGEFNHDRGLYYELEMALEQPLFGKITVFQLSEVRGSTFIGSYQCESLEQAVKCFRSESNNLLPVLKKRVSDSEKYEQESKGGQRKSWSLGESLTKVIEISEDMDESFDGESCILKSNIQTLEAGRLESRECADTIICLYYKGSSCKGNETSRLVLIIVLSLVLTRLQIGGKLICEVGDFFSNASAGLFYLFSRIFKRVAIFKATIDTHLPIRVLVCEEFKGDTGSLMQYVKKLLVTEMGLAEHGEEEIIHVLPIHYIFQDDLVAYLRRMNTLHMEIQLRGLSDIHLAKKASSKVLSETFT